MNKEKIKGRYTQNREKCINYRREYYTKNREKLNNDGKEYYKQNKYILPYSSTSVFLQKYGNLPPFTCFLFTRKNCVNGKSCKQNITMTINA